MTDTLKNMKHDRSPLVEILKDRYEYEQFRRNNFDNVIGLPVTILALLLGGLAAFVFQKEDVSNVIKFGALLGIAPIAVSIAYLIRVFFGARRNYDVLPTGVVIKEQYERLFDYHKEVDPTEPINQLHQKVNLSFQEDLIK